MVGEGRPSTSLPAADHGPRPALHTLRRAEPPQDVDARAKPEHDGRGDGEGGDSVSRCNGEHRPMRRRDVIPEVLTYAAVVVLVLTTLAPLLWLFIMSISSTP